MAMLTRQQAAAELVDGAIAAWFEERFACAITLAGAAETGMPKPDDGASLFAAMREATAKFGQCSTREAVTMMNQSRDWLKHWSEDKPDSISVEFAWVYVLRAYWHFRFTYKDAEQTDNMARFEARISEEAQPIRAVVEGFYALLQRLSDAFAGRPHHRGSPGSRIPTAPAVGT